MGTYLQSTFSARKYIVLLSIKLSACIGKMWNLGISFPGKKGFWREIFAIFRVNLSFIWIFLSFSDTNFWFILFTDIFDDVYPSSQGTLMWWRINKQFWKWRLIISSVNISGITPESWNWKRSLSELLPVDLGVLLKLTENYIWM